MTTLPHLESDRIIMRLANQEDVPAILNFYTENQAHLAAWEPQRNTNFYTEEYWQQELELRWQDFHSDRACKLFVFLREDSRVIIGAVNFANFIRGAFQSCTLGYSLAAAYQKQGYMTEALKIAIAYVFTQLNMHRIMAAYMPRNQYSGKLLKKLGFVVEGYACDYLLINAVWEDHIMTSLINSDWQK